MAWDRVYTVHDYYDGPRLGVADVDGVPHIYEAEFDHSSDDYGDTYFVSPMDMDFFTIVIEAWKIWLRWDAAFKRGDVPLQSHPALPEDRERYEVLKIARGDRLRVDQKEAVYMKADFKMSPEGSLIVEWQRARQSCR